MAIWNRVVGAVEAHRIVSAFGLLYVALAAGKVVSVATAGGTLTSAVADFLLIGVPGFVLLYGGPWLQDAKLPPDLRWRLVGWCFTGLLVMLGILLLVNLEPGVLIAHPVWTFLLGTSIGTAVGFLVGANDVRAVARAREIRAVNRKLEQANSELERQNDRLESFASMLAHELRNPLNIAQLYLPGVSDGDESALAEVQAAHDRIEEMIEILLVTARKVESDADAEETVALADVATAAWEDIYTQHASLSVETDLTVRANSVHLRHLLENLFKNSIEHGGEDVTVTVGSLPTGFYVADDGRGIPAENRGDVFDAGYTTGGIGFGLTFVSRIVEMYDWNCEIVESEDGGARFEFTGVTTAPESEADSVDERHRH